jgi:hypothetical protein
MPDYKNGKIYKIWSPQGDDIYIGSTIQPLYARLYAHKEKMNTCNSKILFEKYDDVRIELLECCPCDNKEQLNKKEGEYIRKLDCVNRRIAGRTIKEWHEDNKEHKKQTKEYRKNNKEKIKEWKKKRITCECGRTTTFGNKAQHEKTKVHQDAMGASTGNGEASISVPTNPCT